MNNEDVTEDNYDTSDEKQVNIVKKKAGRNKADRLDFISAAMGTEQGRAWFFYHLNRCYLFKTPYFSESSYDTAFRCGEQNVGLQLLSDIQEAAPELYLTMLKEHKS